MYLKRSITACLTAALAAVLFSADADAQRRRMSLSERVTALEEQMANAAQQDNASRGASQDDLLLDLLGRVDQLQLENQNLRDLVERQADQIQTLQNAQRTQYLDLDQRMKDLQDGAGAFAGGPRPVDPNATAGWPDSPGSTDVGFSSSPQQVTVPDNTTVSEPISTSSTSQPLPTLRDPVNPELTVQSLEGDANNVTQAVAGAPEAEEDAYKAAFEQLKSLRFDESSRQFLNFLDDYPNSELADNAQYWLAESYYGAKNYRIALEAFETMVSRYPSSPKLSDAMLKIGYTHYELEDFPAAGDALNRVVERFPGSTVARLAGNRLRVMRLEGQID